LSKSALGKIGFTLKICVLK